MEKYIKPNIGRMEMASLRPGHVRAMEGALMGQGVTAAGVRMVHVVLSGAMAVALQLELVGRNVVSQVTPPCPPGPGGCPAAPRAVLDILDVARAEDSSLFASSTLSHIPAFVRGEAWASSGTTLT